MVLHYVSIVDASVDALAALEPEDRERVLVLGGRYALDINHSVYPDRLAARCPESELAMDQDVTARVNQAMFMVKKGQKGPAINEVCRAIQGSGITTVLLLSTELSELGLHRHGGLKKAGIRVVDGLDAYCTRLADAFFDCKPQKRG